MVPERIFTGLALAAGETSEGVLLNLGKIGAAGYFGLEVDCQDAVTISYKASGDDDTPGAVAEDEVLAEHAGGGKVCYAPAIGPYHKIWLYATAPGGSAVAGLNVTLNIW